MTLLSICKDVADVVGVTRPAAIITGQDEMSRFMLGFAKETLTELGLMDWPLLQIPYTFDTVANQGAYDLPADFGREVGDTVYTNSRYNAIRGSLTPAQWAKQRNTLPELGMYRFRLFGLPLKLNITPTPTAVDSVVLEYQTTYRVRRSNNAYAAVWTADSDTPLFDEDLVTKGIKWRLRRQLGLDYSEEFNDYEMSRSSRLAQQLDLGSQPVAYRRPGYDDDYPYPGYIPETGFGV